MIKVIRNIDLQGMVLNMDYDLKIMQNENGFWYICSYGYILDGFGSFETKEQAERVIKLFNKTKVGNLGEANKIF